MTAETTRVRNLGRQRGVRAIRVVIDVAGEAAAAAIEHDVVGVLGLRLAEMAARTELAQHRVGHAVTERLQVNRLGGAGRAVDKFAGDAHHAMSRVHDVAFANIAHCIGVTLAAGCRSVREVPGESHQAFMGGFLAGRAAVPDVTGCAVAGSECVFVVEPGLPRVMALQAAIEGDGGGSGGGAAGQ